MLADVDETIAHVSLRRVFGDECSAEETNDIGHIVCAISVISPHSVDSLGRISSTQPKLSERRATKQIASEYITGQIKERGNMTAAINARRSSPRHSSTPVLHIPCPPGRYEHEFRTYVKHNEPVS